jgi:hypothetical protein
MKPQPAKPNEATEIPPYYSAYTLDGCYRPCSLVPEPPVQALEGLMWLLVSVTVLAVAVNKLWRRHETY